MSRYRAYLRVEKFLPTVGVVYCWKEPTLFLRGGYMTAHEILRLWRNLRQTHMVEWEYVR